MPTGTVKNWVAFEGFGLIVPDDGSEDVFVRVEALNGSEYLDIGAQVKYEAAWDDLEGKIVCTNCTGSGAGRNVMGHPETQ